MSVDLFRRLALALAEAVESSHMAHPDFRVGGRIFATLWWDDQAGEDRGMVKLTPAQQRAVVTAHPKTFQPVKGGWGRQGCTQVNLTGARAGVLRPAIQTAWQNIAPARLSAPPPKATRAKKAAGRRAKRPAG